MINYSSIVEYYEQCFQKFGDNCKGVDWPNQSDAEKRYRVMLDVAKFQNATLFSQENVSILDFGCGLGHLYHYIKENNYPVTYSGLDISKIFVESCKSKYEEVDFFQGDILNGYKLKKYDFIILNGVFTEKREQTYEDMFKYFKQMLNIVFSYADRGIAFNLMSKNVDWERDDLFHVSLDTISEFLTKEVSRNFIIRNDYGLYEYTVYVYR